MVVSTKAIVISKINIMIVILLLNATLHLWGLEVIWSEMY